MNKKKFLAGLLTAGMLFQMTAVTSFASGTTEQSQEPYTYTITFYAGNQGSFTSAAIENITVSNEDKPVQDGKVAKRIDDNGRAITITGLKRGDQVTFDGLQEEEEGAPVERKDNSQYYVRGLRKGGFDNSESKENTSPSFTVEQDQDYVIAYGIWGDKVSYVIHYQDRAGNTLAPSRTYHGNVGDRPVVAFRYIERYQPQAYNLTKELVKNEAENVFTFVYTRVAGGGGVTEEIIDGGTTVTEIQGEGQTAAGGGGAGGGAGGGGGAGAGAGNPGEGAEENTNLADEEVPLSEGPQDLINLDDEDTPLGFSLDNLGVATNMLGAVVVGASGAAALLALIVILVRRRRRAAAEKVSEKE